MTVPLPDAARAALESDALCHLVTLNPDGSPQVSCVWTALDGDDILVASIGPRQKLRNVERDPRVALSIEAEGHDRIGLRRYLVVHGTARIQEGGAPEVLQQMATRYLGPGVRFPPMPDPPPGFVMRIRPERLSGNGPWAAAG